MFGGAGGPFKLPTAENQEREKLKKDAILKVKGWVEEYIPDEYLADRTAVVDVSEAACGDPECSPIDTVVRIIFANNCGCIFGVPCEVVEVEKEDIEDMMPPEEYYAEWKAGNNQLRWPPEPEAPKPGEPPQIELRFPVGTRVQCCIAQGPDGWAPGTIVAHWYRASSWPPGQFAPYQIKLDIHEQLIFAPRDSDQCIRLLQENDAVGPAAQQVLAQQQGA